MQTLFYTSETRKVSYKAIFHGVSTVFAIAVACYEAHHLIHMVHEMREIDRLSLAAGAASALHTVIGTARELLEDALEHRS